MHDFQVTVAVRGLGREGVAGTDGVDVEDQEGVVGGAGSLAHAEQHGLGLAARGHVERDEVALDDAQALAFGLDEVFGAAAGARHEQEALAGEIAFERAQATGEQRFSLQRQFVLGALVAGFKKAPAPSRHRDDDHRMSTPGRA
jgi:hypothetical protein